MPPLSPIDIKRVRERLASERGPRFWRSLEELADTDEFRALLADEFPRLEPLWEASISRRNVLKLMAASMALAGLTACDRQPTELIVPYVNMPEGMVPGEPKYYATTHPVGGYAHGLLAETHEGRPTKVEGNPEHPATLGACDVFSQASVLSLYDPDRSSAVRWRGEVASYSRLLVELGDRQGTWDANGGRGLCLLTETLTSPSQYARLQDLLKRWPEARWYAYEPVDRSAVFAGSELLFGRPLEPIYRFSQPSVVVSLDADFLASMPGFLRYAHDFISHRRPRDGITLSRLYVAEATPSITGAAADHRHRVTYQQIDALTRQLARKLGLNVAAPAQPVDDRWVSAVADELQANHGKALVVPGDQQPPAVHAIAQAINHHIGAYGRGVVAIEPVDYGHQARPLEELTAAMHAGEVRSLVVLGGNPVYTAPADLDFRAAYTSVPWRLHWGERDETARLSLWHVPAAHPMETWGDARAYQGTVSLIQPLLRPMNGGRTGLQMLAALGESIDHDPAELLVDYWRERHGGGDFVSFWRRSLHDGMVPDTESKPAGVKPRPGWQRRLPEPAADEQELVLQLRPDPAIWDGRYANNGWLQEVPRPLTKMTWGNVLLVSPALAEAENLTNGAVMRVATGERHLDVPVYVLPGQTEGAVTLHLGYGRTAAGRIAEGVGRNAYELRTSTTPWAVPVTLTKRGYVERLPITQQHQAIMGRDLIRVADLEHYRKDPLFAHKPQPDVSLYPEPWPAPREAKHEWGMAVDLSACIGCNACVVACQAENNIPIVGPEEVARGHEMHWLRIDRYFDGPLEGPRLVFQPVPCMHCENAPCEYVCPVGATQHTASGLNMMIYQRCIGTRDCSQNCPYKVRRFNWFDYTGPESEYPDPKAVKNPSVTVRYRGVMEKCTYCVQRIQAAEIAAKSEDRPIRDAELKTACQQACPTRAIVFGDIADETSEVHKLKEHPLNYAMLGELNTRPRTTYLAAVRNPNPALQEPGSPSPQPSPQRGEGDRISGDYPGSDVSLRGGDGRPRLFKPGGGRSGGEKA